MEDVQLALQKKLDVLEADRNRAQVRLQALQRDCALVQMWDVQTWWVMYDAMQNARHDLDPAAVQGMIWDFLLGVLIKHL